MSRDIAASVRARLFNIAKAEGSDFNQMLVRYTLERLLYRISTSAYADQFLLKGALLFTLWYDMPHRPTRDVDLLGFGPSDLTTLTETFREISAGPCPDGLVFDAGSVRAEEIRKDAGYAGARVLVTATLAGARSQAQVDIGFGDAVTPAPVAALFPVLLHDLPSPQLRTYPVYTVIAEKLHAITLLGMTNTRLKDYLDLHVILGRETLDMALLARAVAATFARRATVVPTTLPVGLSDVYAFEPTRVLLWRAFIRRNALSLIPLENIVQGLREKLLPVLDEAAKLSV